MTRLRQKLEDEPDTPKFFQTEPGIGYRFTG
jgi:DNA-binding response OmpR family regulator